MTNFHESFRLQILKVASILTLALITTLVSMLFLVTALSMLIFYREFHSLLGWGHRGSLR